MFIINNHIKNTIYLAWPLVITQVGYIITGMVDTVFLGKIGAAEQAACILSNNLYILLLVFGIGVSSPVSKTDDFGDRILEAAA